MRVWGIWPLGEFSTTIDIGDNRNRRKWQLLRRHNGWYKVRLQRIIDWAPSWPFEPVMLRDYTTFLDDFNGYCILDVAHGLILARGSQHLKYITLDEMNDILDGVKTPESFFP